MIHALKTLPEYFSAVQNLSKTFEVRKRDRSYAVGDFLALNEYVNGDYTGACLIVRVTYVLDNSEYCKGGYVILGIEPCGISGNFNHFEPPYHDGRGGMPIYNRKVAK